METNKSSQPTSNSLSKKIIDDAYKCAIDHFNVEHYTEADKLCKAIIQAVPEHINAINLLGAVAQKANRHDLAIEQFQKAIKIDNDRVLLYYNLGTSLYQLGRREEAINVLKNALEKEPENSHILNYLDVILNDPISKPGISDQQNRESEALQRGISFHLSSQIDEAVKWYQRALDLNPRNTTALTNMGSALQAIEKLDEAVTNYQKAITIQPDRADTHSHLGVALQKQGKLEEAVTSYQKAISIKPDYAGAYSNLGAALKDQGKFEEAITSYEKAISIIPDLEAAHSNLLLCSQYLPDQTLENLFLIHKAWANSLSTNEDAKVFHHNNDISPSRKLRIGFVSGDLGYHPVGYFMAGFFKHHPVSKLEIICYSDRNEDELTKLLKSYSEHWVSTEGMEDNELAQLIHGDSIDILIDLSGHTAKNRLAMFATKPAPIQISWAGYVGTTGLPAMDWLIADKHYVTDDEDKFYTENIIRLPDAYVCYTPPEYAPKIVSRSLEEAKKRFVIGCFCNPPKINDKMLDAWSHILQQCPQAVLLLIYKGMDSFSNVQRINSFFEKSGIDIDRIIIEGQLPHRKLLAKYNSIDLVLDTFPYSGGLTTVEALFMGVPVVTTCGATFASRHSTSYLRNIGLDRFVTNSLDEYIQLAVDLASNPKELQEAQKGLRNRLLDSPICDYNKFSLDLTKELRKIWTEWCVSKNQHKTL
jgi:protein O-GlcNAc transferase